MEASTASDGGQLVVGSGAEAKGEGVAVEQATPPLVGPPSGPGGGGDTTVIPPVASETTPPHAGRQPPSQSPEEEESLGKPRSDTSVNWGGPPQRAWVPSLVVLVRLRVPYPSLSILM